MNDKIAIMTDTVANLPYDFIKKNNIYVISLYVVIDEKYYKDGIEINSSDMFRLNEEKSDFMAKSSSPSPNNFSIVYEQIKNDGFDKIIFIGMGSNLSSTMTNAKIAEDYGLEIAFIDSKTVTILEGLLVMYATDLLKKGLSFEEIVKKVNLAVGKSIAYGWIDDLSHLKAGGRLGKAAKKASTLLNLKPFMSIDGMGEFELYKLKIAKEKSYKKVEKKIREDLKDINNYYMAYLYGNDYHILDEVKTDLADLEDKALGVFEAATGSVVAVHVGPKIYAVAYLIIDWK